MTDLAKLKCVCGHRRDEHAPLGARACRACTCPKFIADQRGLDPKDFDPKAAR